MGGVDGGVVGVVGPLVLLVVLVLMLLQITAPASSPPTSTSSTTPAAATATSPRRHDVLRPVNREGSHQGETKCIPTTSTNSDSLLNTHSTVEDLEKFGENEVE